MKYYPDSKVEIQGFIAKYYDGILNFVTLGLYSKFINKVIESIEINSDDKILDFGAGTGRNALLMNSYKPTVVSRPIMIPRGKPNKDQTK